MEDRGIPRPGRRVLSRGVNVGHVTSGTMSPSLRVGIALASVDRGHASHETSLKIDVRGTPHAARVVPLPFLGNLHQRGTFGEPSEDSYRAAPDGPYGPHVNKRGNSGTACW